MDSLMEIPRQKWTALQELYRSNWPKGIVASCLLDTQIRYPGLNEAFGFKVYCPHGDLSKGMVAVINTEKNYQVIIQPITDTQAIEQALLSTTVINWNRNITVPSASSEAIACLDRVKAHVGVKVEYSGQYSKAFKYVLRRNSKPFENVSFPPNTYVGPLKPEHIKIIDTNWTFHSEHSHYLFETLMKNDLAYVLYSIDHQPLAWVTVNEAGSLTHLYCLEDHRRKGYAEFISKFVANDLLEKGRDVLAYTIEGNVSAQKLYAKLGFETIGYDKWVFVNKIK